MPTKSQLYYRRRRDYVDGLAVTLGIDPRHCARCGKPRTGKRSLHWHHRDPADKVFVLSNISGRTEEEILVELRKCDRICKACHGSLHSVAATGSVRPHPSGRRHTVSMNFATKQAAEEARRILLDFRHERGE